MSGDGLRVLSAHEALATRQLLQAVEFAQKLPRKRGRRKRSSS